MTIAVEQLTGQGLIPESLFRRLVSRIVREHDYTREYASRIMDQALAFVATCGKTLEPLSPSEAVDIGWHTFILYTRDYAAFCHRVVGSFVHHVPNDDESAPSQGSPDELRDRTVSAMARVGYYVDEALWPVRISKCNQCTDGCTHSSGDTGCHHHPVRTDSVPA